MKKTEKFKYFILGITASAFIFGSGVFAATTYIKSENVEYTDNSDLGVTNVQAAIDGTCTKFNTQLTTLESTIIDKIYPVGSIYISETDDTVEDVQTRFGGTWVAYGTGKTLIGAGTGTDANGTSQTFSVSNNSSNLGEYKHKLTTTEMPSHTHNNTAVSSNIYGNFGVAVPGNHSNYVDGVFTATNFGSISTAPITTVGTATLYGYRLNYTPTITMTNASSGGDGYHNNVQPYVTVYMYKRTA